MVSSPALQKHGGQALHSATKTADKKDGGQALDLLTIALKTDSNKPSRLRILETAARIVSSQVTKVLPPHLLRGLKASSPYLHGVVLSGFMEILKEK